MSLTFFEDLDSTYIQPHHKDPIWTLKLDDEGNERKILDWLTAEASYLATWNRERFQEIEKNLRLFKNIQYQNADSNRNLAERQDIKSAAMQKITVNHLGDMVKNRTARLIKYRPGISVLPSNDEHQDKISAKMTKMLIDNIWYNQDFDSEVIPRMAIEKNVIGESYLWIDWDPDQGDLHPESPKTGKKVGLKDEDGKPVVDESGNPIFLEEEIRVGDVKYEVVMAMDVLLQSEKKISDAQYCFRRKIMPTAYAKLLYPKKSGVIRPDEEAAQYNFNTGELEKHGNRTVVWEFWHKRCKQMQKGRKITFTKDGILENIEHPFNHGDLPFERLIDQDYPGELHGVSFFRNVRGLQGVVNNLTNMVIRNQHMVAHPKWMVPAGSVRLDQLGNDITLVQYKGPQPPVLAQANPTPGEVFNFREKAIQEMGQLSGVFQVSRGETPPGIKAGVALQFLSEQESERYNEDILRYNEFIKRVAIKTIAVASDYYDPSDERMVRVIGTNNKWMTVFFDAANLSKSYDIRVQNASALPQSKAARMQTLLDLNGQFPNLVTPEMVLDMLDLAQSDKFIDVTTVAVRAAQAENEFIGEGKDVQVEEYEDHFQHWVVHAASTQEFAFKAQMPEKAKEKMKKHIAGHELMMFKKAQENPAYMQKLQTLSNFPMFMSLAAVQPSPESAPEMEPKPAGGQMAPEGQLPVQEGMPSMEEQAAMESALPMEPPPETQSGAV